MKNKFYLCSRLKPLKIKVMKNQLNNYTKAENIIHLIMIILGCAAVFFLILALFVCQPLTHIFFNISLCFIVLTFATLPAADYVSNKIYEAYNAARRAERENNNK